MNDALRIGATALALTTPTALAQDAPRVYAAGSLRAVMTELALASTADVTTRPRFEFGAWACYATG